MAYKVIQNSSDPDQDPLARKVAALLPALIPQATILETRIDIEAGPIKLNLLAKVKIGNATKTLLCQVQSKGEPKYLLNAIGRFQLAAKRFPNAYPVVVTTSLSREGRAVLREAGVGWLTTDGEALLQFDAVFIERESKAATTTVQNILKSARITQRRQRRLPLPFSARSSRIVRALLERPDQVYVLRDLAQEAGITLRTADLAAISLIEKGYAIRENGPIRLVKPKELLDAWAAVYKFQEANQLSYYYSLARDFEELATKLRALPADLRDNYRLTLYAGASLVAPQMRFNEVHLYVRGDLADWAKRLDLSPVESGANTILVTPYDAGVFDFPQEKKGLMVASNTQLYLDLVNLNDRARDQAEALFKESISRPKPGTLGELIKKARLERMGMRGNMTRQGLGDFVGVSADKIGAWEENAAVPNAEELTRLAKWLRKPIQYFQTSKTNP
ncbi:MAG TPA: hypothetical protein DEB40_05935 [Elusimicrobia bacterium]|nr:hypothetical protein [Elusimicrobiota bacterium]HBT61266.1 hypothetical protein [Elusimicrobiota bacterium]